MTPQMSMLMLMQFPVPMKKILGITIDNQVKFGKHIKNQCKKASDKLHELRRIKFFTDKKIRLPADAFINSLFSRGPMWLFTSKNAINKTCNIHREKLQTV